MNATEQRIRDIIRDDVCGGCTNSPDSGPCYGHKSRCYKGYDRQAHAIYHEVVEPLERLGRELAGDIEKE